MGATFLELILAGDPLDAPGLSELDRADLVRAALDVAPPGRAADLAAVDRWDPGAGPDPAGPPRFAPLFGEPPVPVPVHLDAGSDEHEDVDPDPDPDLGLGLDLEFGAGAGPWAGVAPTPLGRADGVDAADGAPGHPDDQGTPGFGDLGGSGADDPRFPVPDRLDDHEPAFGAGHDEDAASDDTGPADAFDVDH